MVDPGGREYLTVQEVAALLRTTPAAIYQWRRRRQGPPSCLIGAHLVFRREDVLSWVAELVDREKQRRELNPPRLLDAKDKGG